MEFADLTTDTPVVDCGLPREKFRVSLLVKSGTGESVFDLQGADDPAFTINVRAVGERRLNPTTEPGGIWYMRAVRGGIRYIRMLKSGNAVYDVRLEWA